MLLPDPSRKAAAGDPATVGERVDEMPAMLHSASGTLELDPVLLHTEADGKLLERTSKQLNQISADD